MSTAKKTESTVSEKSKKRILMSSKGKIIKCYIAGSMEGRQYEDLKYEHFYVRTQLNTIGLEVFDPLVKEDHAPGRTVGLKNCGLDPQDVYHQDLTAVEEAAIIFWVTGDIQSEGSVTEVAWAGAMNKFGLDAKWIVIVSPKRASGQLNHFANMHPGVKVVKSVDDGIQYIREVLGR